MRCFFALIFCIGISLLFFQCTIEPTDAPMAIEDVLPGNWELVGATRNGKKITSLTGTYFEFDSLGTISTNLGGEEVITDFKVQENSIVYNQANVEKKLDFTVRHEDTLQFNLTMREIWNFELTLHRIKGEN